MSVTRSVNGTGLRGGRAHRKHWLEGLFRQPSGRTSSSETG